MRFLFLLAALVLTSGCAATKLQPLVFDDTRIFAKPRADVWDNLMAFFKTSGITIQNKDKNNGIVVARRTLLRASIYTNCGASDVSSVQNGVLDVKIHLQPLPQKKTRVSVDVSFSGDRVFMGLSKTRVKCASNGSLEAEIFKNL